MKSSEGKPEYKPWWNPTLDESASPTSVYWASRDGWEFSADHMRDEMCNCKITRCVVFDELLASEKIAELAHNAATMTDDEWLEYLATISGASID